MQTAPAGLLRMRELRNRHLKGDFVPAGGALPWRRQDGGAAQAVTEGLSKFVADRHNNPPASQARHRLTQVDLALGQQFCVHMQNCQLMCARTPHRGAAHDARIRPLHREGVTLPKGKSNCPPTVTISAFAPCRRMPRRRPDAIPRPFAKKILSLPRFFCQIHKKTVYKKNKY